MTAVLAATRPSVRLDSLPWGFLLAVLTVVLFAIAAIWPQALATHDPYAIDLAAALQQPSLAHWFGTDESGRDLYSRVVFGTRESLGIGLGAAAVSLSLAVLLGTLAGLGGRATSAAVGWLLEVAFAFPALLLSLLLIAVLGPSALTQVLAVGVGTAPGYARIVRGQVLAAKGSGYVETAVSLGHSRARILGRHILPNALRPLVAIFALSVGQSIVWASSLSFLGLGVAPPSPEWGALLDAGRAYITVAPWLTVTPGLVIVTLALAATTLGRHLQLFLEKGEKS
jgi:peptide/nickel transport system permease protein